MRALADMAGPVLRAGLGQPAVMKPDGTPVTDDDGVLNTAVIEAVRHQHPWCAVIGEEESWYPSGGYDDAIAGGGTFVVDPIDGTAAYAAGLGVAAFAMAYLRDGVLTAALIDDPYAGCRFTAVAGEGAYLDGTRVRVGTAPRSEQVFVEGVRSGVLAGWSAEVALRDAGFTLARFRAFLSPGARVATGAVSGAVFGHTSLHDCAPLALVAAEAGATVTDLSGGRWAPGSHDGIIAAHPTMHATLLELVTAGRTGTRR